MENNEVMEEMNEMVTVEGQPTELMVTEPEEVSEGGSGNGLKVALAIGAGVIAAGAAGYKWIKSKKDDKPKKKTKKRLRLVDVPIEEEEGSEVIADGDYFEDKTEE